MSNSRALTPNEIILARKVFRDSIDYAKVKIHDRSYIFFQPARSGMTPNGEIYFNCGQPSICSADFGRTGNQGLFIHEMAHVWQKQNHVLNPTMAAVGEFMRNLGNYGNAYRYTLDPGKDLTDYRIEQQAEIIEAYFRSTFLGQAPPGSVSDLRSVLAKFLNDPKYPRHARSRRRATANPRHVR